MSPSVVRARRRGGVAGGGSGFSSGVSEGSHYRRGKSAALSLQSWPRSLLFVLANTDHKSSISGASLCLVSLTDLTAPLHYRGTPKYRWKNASIRLKYALLYRCYDDCFFSAGKSWMSPSFIQLCIHSRNHDHSLAVCSLMPSVYRQLHFARKRREMLYLWALTRFQCDISFP